MLRLIIASAIALAATAAAAQEGPAKKGKMDPVKLEKCKQLASERGFTPGKGSNMKSFVISCMQGKQH